eukprot:SAG22_NODE_10853_length_513_cov_0.920290_1_plen_70_part_10
MFAQQAVMLYANSRDLKGWAAAEGWWRAAALRPPSQPAKPAVACLLPWHYIAAGRLTDCVERETGREGET